MTDRPPELAGGERRRGNGPSSPFSPLRAGLAPSGAGCRRRLDAPLRAAVARRPDRGADGCPAAGRRRPALHPCRPAAAPGQASAPPAFSPPTSSGGLLLLEDFGNATSTRLLAEGEPEEPLYRLAVDVLIALGQRVSPGRCGNAAALRRCGYPAGRRAPGFDWYWPAATAAPGAAAERERYRTPGRRCCRCAMALPEGPALFDYHVDNLLLLPVAPASPPAACSISRARCGRRFAST